MIFNLFPAAQIANITFQLLSPPSALIPVFSLTCISSGGPVAAVTWHKDNVTLPIAITGPLVLDDGVTATYHNDLKVTGRLPGTYTCQIKDDGDSVLDTLMDYDVPGMSCYTVIGFNYCTIVIIQSVCCALPYLHNMFNLAVISSLLSSLSSY